jgi:hypothetical protein
MHIDNVEPEISSFRSEWQHRSRAHRMIRAGVGACFMLAACAGDSGADHGGDAPSSPSGGLGQTNVIAEAALEDGRTLKFVEPTPGTLIEIEQGRSDVSQAAEPADLDFVERYEFLTGKPAPEALVLAQQRSQPSEENADGNEKLDFASTGNKGKVSPAEYIDSGTFRSSYCVATDRNYLYTDVTGYANWSATGVNYFRGGSRCNTGTTEVVMGYYTKFGGDSLDTWVPAGTYVALRMSSSLDAQAYVTVYADAWVDFYDLCWNWHY